jgi:cell shape-determining protein MreC
MRRAILTSQRAFPITLIVTVAVALLPKPALRLFNPFVEVYKIVLGPFAEMGNRVGGWLRPTASSGNSEEVNLLRDEMGKWQRRCYIAEQQADELRGKIEQLQRVSIPSTRVRVLPIEAPISLRSAGSSIGAVTLNRGSSQGVKPGTIAVFDGQQLIGRVTNDVSAVHSSLLPITNPQVDPIMARAVPPGAVELPTSSGFEVRPAGDGTFVAEPDKTVIVNEGDEVRLFSSEGWPESAQGMVIGVVESVRNNDKKPLRNLVTVRPTVQVAQLAYVILVIEQEEGGGARGNGP